MRRRTLLLSFSAPLLAQTQREELLRLPNYTAFDWLTLGIEDGKPVLAGATPNPLLKRAAERALQLSASNIELLPISKSDDDLRLAVWAKLQSDPALRAAKPPAPFHRDHFLGAHAIHVLVDKGIVTLHGRVPTAALSAQANRLANTVPGLEQVRNFLFSTP